MFEGINLLFIMFKNIFSTTTSLFVFCIELKRIQDQFPANWNHSEIPEN